MAKIVFILVLVGVVITVQGLPSSYEEILAAAKAQLQGLLQNQYNNDALKKPAVFDGIRNLKPTQGGKVYGEAEYAFHSATNINGRTKEDIGGHKVINNNGKVKEFDFVPSTIAPINLLKFNSGSSNLKPIMSNAFGGYSIHANPSAFNAKNPARIENLPALPSLAFGGVPELKTPQLGQLAFAGVRDLKPGKDSHVYGEAEYTFHSASDINGKKVEDHAGHKIINNDGKIKEFDFTPSTDYAPIALKQFPLSILDKDIAELKKIFMAE